MSELISEVDKDKDTNKETATKSQRVTVGIPVGVAQQQPKPSSDADPSAKPLAIGPVRWARLCHLSGVRLGVRSLFLVWF